MSSLNVGKLSFEESASITYTLHLDQDEYLAGEVTNLCLDVIKLDTERNHLAYGFGSRPSRIGSSLELSHNIPDSVATGLFGIFSAHLTFTDRTPSTHRVFFEPVYFIVQATEEPPITPNEIRKRVAEIQARRDEYRLTPIIAHQADVGSEPVSDYSVFVFGVGCLLHAPQHLRGYSILPLGRGLSHSHMHEVVASHLADIGLGPLPLDSGMEAQFQHSTPTFVLTFYRVRASDHREAVNYCTQYAEHLFLLLGYERGQLPRIFSTVIQRDDGHARFAYNFPGYRGNLISDFDPASTARVIEELSPVLQRSPWATLLLRNYAQASAEDRYDFQLFRYWTVLELVAKRNVERSRTQLTHPDGSLIQDHRERPRRTQTTQDRVYKYVLDCGAFRSQGVYHEGGEQKSYLIGATMDDPAYTPSTEIISLWNFLSAIYAIRNSTAHEGGFDVEKGSSGTPAERLASGLRLSGQPDPLTYCKSYALRALSAELVKLRQK